MPTPNPFGELPPPADDFAFVRAATLVVISLALLALTYLRMNGGNGEAIPWTSRPAVVMVSIAAAPVATHIVAWTHTHETGTPVAPIALEGSGHTVTAAIHFPAESNRLTFATPGDADAWAVWHRPGEVDRLVVHQGGAASSEHLVEGYGPNSFEVMASGPWSIRIEPIARN